MDARFHAGRAAQGLIALALLGLPNAVSASGATAAADGNGESTVETLVAEALASNPELQYYQAELAAARAGRRISGAWANPEAEVQMGYKRSEDRGSGHLLGDGAAWSVTVSQTFDFPGRLSLRKAIANRQMEIATLGLEQFRAALAARVRQQTWRARVAQDLAQATREVRDRLQELALVLVQRDPAGVTPLLEARVIEANVITWQRRVTQAETALQTARLELNLLLGRAPQAPLRVAPTTFPFPAPPALEDLLALARTNNFDLRLRQAELEQQGFQVRLAQRERWPAVTLSPYYSSERAADQETTVGLGLSLPLPLWNRKQGETDQARARLLQAETLMRVSQRQVEQQVTTHALAYATQRAEMARWRPDAAGQLREAAELGDRHYRLGALPVGTYLELQKQYLEATEALLHTQADALEAWQQLELLAGRPLAAIPPNPNATPSPPPGSHDTQRPTP
ncbi:MAG: TolC family protein [Verrucomicrobia bacterium]|nr:TolC family protein [Verrucomicrobiota bacterium]